MSIRTTPSKNCRWCGSAHLCTFCSNSLLNCAKCGLAALKELNNPASTLLKLRKGSYREHFVAIGQCTQLLEMETNVVRIQG